MVENEPPLDISNENVSFEQLAELDAFLRTKQQDQNKQISNHLFDVDSADESDNSSASIVSDKVITKSVGPIGKIRAVFSPNRRHLQGEAPVNNACVIDTSDFKVSFNVSHHIREKKRKTVQDSVINGDLCHEGVTASSQLHETGGCYKFKNSTTFEEI